MNERLLTEDPLVEIEALRRQSPASALSRLNDAPPELFARPNPGQKRKRVVDPLPTIYLGAFEQNANLLRRQNDLFRSRASAPKP